MFTVTLNTLNKAKYIKGNKDTIKRHPVTSLMHFMPFIDDNNSIKSLKLFFKKRNAETELFIA